MQTSCVKIKSEITCILYRYQVHRSNEEQQVLTKGIPIHPGIHHSFFSKRHSKDSSTASSKRTSLKSEESCSNGS
jgi:hypothetical protein